MKLLVVLFSISLFAGQAFANDYRIAQAMNFMENIYSSSEPAKKIFVNRIFTAKFQNKIKRNPALFRRVFKNFKSEKSIMQSPDTHAGVNSSEIGVNRVKLIYLLKGSVDPTQTYLLLCPRGDIPNGTCLIDDIQ